MTLLPVDSWNAKGRPDLPAYELNNACASPLSNELATDNHHLWRRSFSPEMRDSWWVELPDGTVVPNRVGLSADAHRMVTENRVRIVFDTHDLLFYWERFTANEKGSIRMPLDPQPGPRGRALQLRIGDTPIEHDDVVAGKDHDHGEVKPGEKCPTCKRRVNHPKTDASPKTKTFSYRVPMDDLEAHEEVLQACAEHMGIVEGKHVLFQVVTVGAALILQTERKDLP